MPSPPITNLLSAIIETVSTLRLQLSEFQRLLLTPSLPPAPPSPSSTLLVPGSPTSITDSSHSTWTLSPSGPSATPTLFLNGHPDPFTGPASLALYLNSTIYFQRATGQWFQWSTDHWTPSTNPQLPTSPDYGPPAHRATTALSFQWLPSTTPSGPTPNFDLLTDLFTDPSPTASTFLPSPIPLVTRPRGFPRPPIYQRSDNTFLIPLFGLTPITLQFPGLRPTFIRLWDGCFATNPTSQPHQPPTPVRTATGTDTIAVPLTRGSLFIIELSLS